MFKLLLKLAIVALLANAAFHVGTEYLAYVKFRDAVRDAAIFKAKTDPDLMARIASLAEQYDVPLDQDNVAIDRQGVRVAVSGWYDKPIELAPSYQYPWHFSFELDVTSQAAALPPAPAPRNQRSR